MGPLIVVYDEGAAQPGDLAVALADEFRCLFVLGPSAHARAMEPLLAQFGTIIPPAGLEETAARLGRHDPAGIVTFSERALPLTSRLAEWLGLAYHDRATSLRLTDKWEQRTALHAAGIEALRFRRLRAAADWAEVVAAVGMPAVLKPANGGASRNTFLVEEAREGEELAARLFAEDAVGFVTGGSLVLEEYLVGRDCAPFGDYVSVESVVAGGAITDVAVTGKLPMIPPFRETGRFWPAPLSPEEEAAAYALAARAVAAVGVRSGITHTELKLTDDGPRLIEVNGRLGGGINELSRRALGTDLIEIAARVAVGAEIPPVPQVPPRVFFQSFHPAPRKACQLLAVEGADVVRDLPGVMVYRPYEKPGSHLPGGVHTQEMDIVIGETETHEELAGLATKAASALRFTFAFDGDEGICSLDGTELGRV